MYKRSSKYITLFRLTGKQSHNTQHNTIILNQTLKREKEDTVNEEHTHTDTHDYKNTKIQSIKQIFT